MADQPYTGPEVDAAVRILREDAQLQHNKRLMDRLDAMEDRLGRMPVQELSAEEKAAAYDRMIAEQKQGKAAPPAAGGTPPPGAPAAGDKDPGTAPPAPAAKTPTPPSTAGARKAWWDGYQSQGG